MFHPREEREKVEVEEDKSYSEKKPLDIVSYSKKYNKNWSELYCEIMKSLKVELS